jgi:predicted nucleic acid-binding protein
LIQTEVSDGHQLVLPSLVVTEFLHVATDSRRFTTPFTMVEAIDWAEEFLANESTSLVEPTEASAAQTLRWMREFNLGRKRILDTHLAAVLHTHGVHRLMTSNPADFSVFGIFELITP